MAERGRWCHVVWAVGTQVVEVQASASCPVLLCSEPGHDASKAVDGLADSLRMHLSSVAMGSEEG